MGKSTDPTQPEHIEPQIDLVADLGPGADTFDDVAFKANKPDYSGLTRNDLELALQNAVDALRPRLTSGFDADVAPIAAMIAQRSPAEEARDLLNEADHQLDAVASGSKEIGEERASELRELGDRIRSLLDELGARQANATAPASSPPAAPAQPKAQPPTKDPPAAQPAAPLPVAYAPVGGATAPGGAPTATRGLSGVAIKYVVAGIIVALVAGAGIIVLGGNGAVPVAASLPPTSAATSGPATAPAATTPVVVQTPAPATPLATAEPGGLIFGQFEVTGDVKVDKCEHRYTVQFKVLDSTSQTAPFVGKTAVFRLLDNEPERTAVIGADGTFTAEVDEHFEKTGSGCFSHLQPKVLTVDGQVVFG